MGEPTKVSSVGEPTKDRSPLLPDRRSVPDFFVCDIFDAAPKGDQTSMEHPVFSISTKPDYKIRRYENNGRYLEVRPGHLGLATIHDRDVLIFCISQLMAALNEGRQVSHKVRFKAYDLMLATNRMTGGDGYLRLKAAFERLQSTQIETNIPFGGYEQIDGFSIIDRYRIIREARDGRMLEVEITLSDWVFDALRANEVLTIHRDYFRLRKPLERRLYEIARKHCGRQKNWEIRLDKLQYKCGSNSTIREFRRLIGSICKADAEHGHMPDYAVRFDSRTDLVTFTSKGTVPTPRLELPSESGTLPPLDASAIEAAREAAPGWDVYHLEQRWRDWCATEEITPNRPGAHFVKFCRSWAEKRG